MILRKTASATRGVMLACVLAAAPVGAQGPSKDAEEVKATLVQMWTAIEAGDVERYATFVHPEFTQFGENDPYLAEGKEAEVRGMAAYLKRATEVHTDMHNAQVTVRGNVAWITYYWTDGGVVEGKRVASHGKSTRIFVKENGRWLCIHGHYTNGT